MTQWTFLLLMNSEPRAEMRVFQIADNQQVSVLIFSGRRSGKLFTMTLVIETDESKAKRIEALLAGLHAVLRVDVAPVRQYQKKGRFIAN